MIATVEVCLRNSMVKNCVILLWEFIELIPLFTKMFYSECKILINFTTSFDDKICSAKLN